MQYVVSHGDFDGFKLGTTGSGIVSRVVAGDAEGAIRTALQLKVNARHYVEPVKIWSCTKIDRTAEWRGQPDAYRVEWGVASYAMSEVVEVRAEA